MRARIGSGCVWRPCWGSGIKCSALVYYSSRGTPAAASRSVAQSPGPEQSCALGGNRSHRCGRVDRGVATPSSLVTRGAARRGRQERSWALQAALA
ncbi:hypothetical protein MRX96_039194 [Rhipicephalus microplus]